MSNANMVVTMLVLGLVAGVLSGMFGIGGGLVIVPALIVGFGFGPKVATGTSMRITSVRSYGAGGTTYGTRTNACSGGRCGAGERSNKTPTIAKVARALAKLSQFHRLDRWPASGSASL